MFSAFKKRAAGFTRWTSLMQFQQGGLHCNGYQYSRPEKSPGYLGGGTQKCQSDGCFTRRSHECDTIFRILENYLNLEQIEAVYNK